MKYTGEQQCIIDTINEDYCTLLKVNSVAGSGKTSVLIGIANALNSKNGLYLAYNKAIATEAASKFPKGVACMTTHSLAHQNTVKPNNLHIGFLNWKVITERIRYEQKLLIIDIINNFFLSKYVTINDFFESIPDTIFQLNKINSKITILIEKYIRKMMSGKIDITHAGYLKMYHMLLHHKKIQHNEFDLIMLDECGDINPVTLEIFKLLPSKKKVMVGDENQNIYTFNNTINGFAEMKDEGIQLNMTQSFRCKPFIANKIEQFCQKYIDPNMQFNGTEPEDSTIKTKAIISRTNSGLVGEMIDLINIGSPFSLTRKASIIFELVMIFLNLKPGGKIYSKEWSYLQDDVEEWNDSISLQNEYKTSLSFIASKYSNDQAVKTTIGLINKYGSKQIYMAFEYAKQHEKEKNHVITLCTAHS